MQTHGYYWCDTCEESAHSVRCQKCHGTATFKPVEFDVIPTPIEAATKADRHETQAAQEELKVAVTQSPAEPKVSGHEWLRRMRELVAQAPDLIK